MGFFDDPANQPPTSPTGANSGFLDPKTGQVTYVDPAQYPSGQTPSGGGDTSWWNPSDPQGSIMALLQGKPLTSQTIQQLKPQFDAVGIQISPANAEGITSKINVPGVGWVRIGDQGVADSSTGGKFSGWTWMPQGEGAGSGGPGGFGSLWATMPTAEEAQNMPGIQFALDEANRGLQAGAAAKGTLLNARTQQGIGNALIGSALSQGYLPLAQLKNQTMQQNTGNLLDLSKLGLSATSVGNQ